jgi:hypothetical protein
LLTSAVFQKGQHVLSLSVTRNAHDWYPYAWPTGIAKPIVKSDAFRGRKLFIVGDSHTGAYATMIQQFSEEYGVETHEFMGRPFANLLRPSNAEDKKRIETTLSEIEKRSAPGDIVFLASLRMNRLSDQWAVFDERKVVQAQQSSEAVAQRTLALREADTIISRLEGNSCTVVIDAPTPIFKAPAFRCSDWFNAGNPICAAGFVMERDFLLEYRRPVMVSLNVLQRNHPNLVVWDPFPDLCPSDSCSAFDEGKPLFFDQDHLSAHGNRVLYPSFVRALSRRNREFSQPGAVTWNSRGD